MCAIIAQFLFSHVLYLRMQILRIVAVIPRVCVSSAIVCMVLVAVTNEFHHVENNQDSISNLFHFRQC